MPVKPTNFSASVKSYHALLPLERSIFVVAVNGKLFAVGRGCQNSDADICGKNRNRLAAFDRNFPDRAFHLICPVKINPMPVGRGYGALLNSFAVGHLFRVSAVGVNSPDAPGRVPRSD